jgi:hypothetical protein
LDLGTELLAVAPASRFSAEVSALAPTPEQNGAKDRIGMRRAIRLNHRPLLMLRVHVRLDQIMAILGIFVVVCNMQRMS